MRTGVSTNGVLVLALLLLATFPRPVLAEEPGDSANANADTTAKADTTKKAVEDAWADSLFMTTDTLAGDPVKYLGQRIEYDMKLDRILLVGQSRVAYKDLKVEADTIEFHLKKDLLVARGKPVLWDNDKWMSGSKMTYSLKTKNGEVLNGKATFEKGFYWGQRIRKIGEGEFNVNYGEFTTCSLTTPHYWFWARRMKIYNDDKVIAEPVVMFLSGIPCVALPFWVFPIKKGRHSGFLIPRVGSSAYEGKYLKNLAYYQVLGDWADATFGMDITEKIGYITNWEGRYLYDPKIRSQVNGSYTDGGVSRVKQWRLTGSHWQTVGPKTNVTGQLDYVSTKEYLSGYSDNRGQRLDRNLSSFLTLQQSWNIASGFLVLDQNRNIDQGTFNQMLPQGRISAARTLTRWLYSSYNATGQNLRTRAFRDSAVALQAGMNQDLNLSSNAKLLEWLTLSPNVAYHETWYDKDKNGINNVRRSILTWGLSANTVIYGVTRRRVGPFLSLRHILSPSVGYSLVPLLRQERFPETFGKYYSSRSFTWNLRNTFQGKLGNLLKPNRLDLLTLDFGDSYNFKAEPGKRWGPLSTFAVFLPSSPVTQVRLSTQHDVYRKRLTSLSLLSSFLIGRGGTNAVASSSTLPSLPGGEEEQAVEPSLPWNFSLSHTYTRGENRSATESQQLWGTVGFHPTRHWRVEYSQRYDLKREEMISQDYVIYRDMHCWEGRFAAQVSGAQWSYEMKISIKAIPDIKAERKRSGTK